MNIKKIFSIILVFSSFCIYAFSDDVSNIIDSLEQKKQEFVNQKNGNPNMESQIRSEARAEYEKGLEQIEDKELRIAQTDAQGRILLEVQEQKIEEKRQLKQKIDAKTQKEIESIKNTNSPYDKQLLQQIEDLEKSLNTERTITSLEDPRLLTVSSYAGDKYCWNTTISFYIQDKEIFSQNVQLNYKNVSGKSPVSIKKSDSKTYNDYLDTVDFYDDALKQNNGTVCLEFVYQVQAMDINQPSTYKITFKKIRFVNIKTKTVLQVVDCPKDFIIYKVNPPVDMRILPNYSINKTITNSNENSKTLSQENFDDNRRGNKTVSTDVPPKAPKKDKKGPFLLGLNCFFNQRYGGNDDEPVLFDFGAFGRFPINNYLFFNLEAKHVETSNHMGLVYNERCSLFQMTCGFGVNYQITTSRICPNLYCYTGLGFATRDPLYINDAIMQKIPAIYCFKCALGCDYKVGKKIVFGVEYDFNFYEYDFYSQGICCNIAIDLN